MRVPFIITVAVIGFILAFVYPFVAVLRGKPIVRVIGRTYGIFVLYMLCLCFLIPAVVSVFDRQFSREMLTHWVPEGPSVVAVAAVGWLPASVAALIGLLVRWLLRTFWPKAFTRVDIESHN